jgi:hypothetical protein
MAKLKQHIQAKIAGEDGDSPTRGQKGAATRVAGGRRGSKKLPVPQSTDNAFTINLKNHKDEILADMEGLRRSVKLQKRANPLEKKMMNTMKILGAAAGMSINQLGTPMMKKNSTIEEFKKREN